MFTLTALNVITASIQAVTPTTIITIGTITKSVISIMISTVITGQHADIKEV